MGSGGAHRTAALEARQSLTLTPETLPVTDPWYGTKQIELRLWSVTEAHLHSISAANIFLVAGEGQDLVTFGGIEIAPVIDVLRKLANP
ncbi:MAG: hypothetical protein AAGA32_14905 [Pseudomonadota bacterium]